MTKTSISQRSLDPQLVQLGQIALAAVAVAKLDWSMDREQFVAMQAWRKAIADFTGETEFLQQP